MAKKAILKAEADSVAAAAAAAPRLAAVVVRVAMPSGEVVALRLNLDPSTKAWDLRAAIEAALKGQGKGDSLDGSPLVWRGVQLSSDWSLDYLMAGHRPVSGAHAWHAPAIRWRTPLTHLARRNPRWSSAQRTPATRAPGSS
jgi:hypothetical protein